MQDKKHTKPAMGPEFHETFIPWCGTKTYAVRFHDRHGKYQPGLKFECDYITFFPEFLARAESLSM